METNNSIGNNLSRILKERDLGYEELIQIMKSKGLKPVTADNLSKITKHNRAFMCTLKPLYGNGYPQTLERICIALDIKSSDLLGY